jgi:hypothetical protein
MKLVYCSHYTEMHGQQNIKIYNNLVTASRRNVTAWNLKYKSIKFYDFLHLRHTFNGKLPIKYELIEGLKTINLN